jgi:hypothetical protein
MSENKSPPPGNMMGGLIAGIIDVQTILALAICNAGYMEPRQLADVFLKLSKQNATADELSGFLPEYIGARAYPARALAATLSGLGLPKDKTNEAKQAFSVILGGLWPHTGRDDHQEHNHD